MLDKEPITNTDVNKEIDETNPSDYSGEKIDSDSVSEDKPASENKDEKNNGHDHRWDEPATNPRKSPNYDPSKDPNLNPKMNVEK